MNRGCRPSCTPMSGLTLIEILVAMSILAILSVLGYKAFSNLLISRERLMDASRQWVELARVFRRMESDWSRLPTELSRELARQMAKPLYPLRLVQDQTGGKLSLTVYSIRNPSGRETVHYQWNPSGLTWRLVGQPGTPDAGPYALLPSGYRVHWRIVLKEGDYRDSWPIDGEPLAFPKALEMRVILPDGTGVSRLWGAP